MKNVLSILIIGLIIAGCSREENNLRQALSHCADIKYIKNLNAYPEIIITKTRKSGIMMELSDREKAIKQYKVDNNIDKSLMGPTELKSKLSNLADEINMKLYMLLNEVLAEASNIQALNEKTIDYKVEHKKDEFFYYAEFHLECWNEYKRDNGYYSEEFIDKYLEWQKQDVSNLGKQSYEFLNGMLALTKNYSYTQKFRDHFTKTMVILPPRN
ncbi:hypothetical protein VP91_00010370 [Candidatus Pelagibacter ubique]|uniref:Lipoprotein n=1 Tax=Pelagibacter ubique TaxID=198252 RepID=A0ABX1T1C6_PELUQ|nr:hypothetical protein [Candidatus Pelagibacter ubique]NMN67886.1 hypothetical protein [Candidatus Pelagibacter ubique]